MLSALARNTAVAMENTNYFNSNNKTCVVGGFSLGELAKFHLCSWRSFTWRVGGYKTTFQKKSLSPIPKSTSFSYLCNFIFWTKEYQLNH